MRVDVYSRAVFKCPHCCIEHYFDQIADMRVGVRGKWWTCSGCKTKLLVKAHWLWGFSYEKMEKPGESSSEEKS